MRNLINKLKYNSLFTFILGGLIFGCIGIYGANIYQSDTIEYSPTDASWEVSNVNEAINSLYSNVTELENIKTLGNATSSQILSGRTAVVQGSTITGTMTNRGAVAKTLNAGGSYTIPEGYHNGNGKVTVNSLASQTSATATAADIASGKTAWVDGTKITGTTQSLSTFTATVYVTQLNSADNGTRYPVTISNPGYKYAKFVFYDLYQRMNVYFDGTLYYTFNAYDTNAGSKTLNNVDISNVKTIKFEPIYVNQVNRVRCDVTLYN